MPSLQLNTRQVFFYHILGEQKCSEYKFVMQFLTMSKNCFGRPSHWVRAMRKIEFDSKNAEEIVKTLNGPELNTSEMSQLLDRVYDQWINVHARNVNMSHRDRAHDKKRTEDSKDIDETVDGNSIFAFRCGGIC